MEVGGYQVLCDILSEFESDEKLTKSRKTLYKRGNTPARVYEVLAVSPTRRRIPGGIQSKW